MNARAILQAVGVEPREIIFSVRKEEAVQVLLDFIKDWKLDIQIARITKKDWSTLIASYADAIFNYHPENYHQVRAVFLCNVNMLKKYGLTDADVWRCDFC